MKLNHDVVRALLLTIENCEDVNGLESDQTMKFAQDNDQSLAEISYIVTRLQEGGLITGETRWGNNVPMLTWAGNLTYLGHNYLDNIRDDGVWKKVKSSIAKVGSASLPIAAGLAEAEIKRRLGLA